MKHIITILFAIFFFNSFSQVQQLNDYLGKITLSVVMDQQTEALYPTQKSKIESKVISLVSRYGISGQGYGANFIINPRLEIYDEQLVEGMRNLYVVTVELNLFIKQAKANIIYSTYNKQLKGTGYSKNEAITNAISQINGNDPDVKIFIEEGKNKIIAFYNSKCNDIITEADKYAAMDEYERSIAILMSVPVEASPCNQKIKEKSVSIFKLYQKKKCQSQIQEAKALSVQKAYSQALQTLTFIDPSSACFTESKTIMSQIQSKMDTEEQRAWEKDKERMKNQVEIEKYQTDAMKNVANNVVGIFSGGEKSGSNSGSKSIVNTVLDFLF